MPGQGGALRSQPGMGVPEFSHSKPAQPLALMGREGLPNESPSTRSLGCFECKAGKITTQRRATILNLHGISMGLALKADAIICVNGPT